MTVVIGLNWPVEHDNACAAIVDGRLVFASEEERHTRHKHSPEEPPINSLFRLLEHLRKLGIKPSDIVTFAINWDPRIFPTSFLKEHYVQDAYRIAKIGAKVNLNDIFVDSSVPGNILMLCRQFLERVFEMTGASLSPEAVIFPVEHHLAHAASAYYFSGFDSAATITVDGSGEVDSTVVWNVKNGEFEKVLALPTLVGSLGFLYESAGWRIGYDTYSGPGKVMGLAAYGRESDYLKRFQNIVHIDRRSDYPYVIEDPNHSESAHSGPYAFVLYSDLLDAMVTKRIVWEHDGEINQEAANLAWAVQTITEEAFIALVEWTKERVGGNRLALAGGVALNSKVNMRIHYSGLFDEVFVFPAAGDSGGPAGAAAYVYEHELGYKMRPGKIQNVYLGPEYEEKTIKQLLSNSKWKAEYLGDDVAQVAHLLVDGHAVAFYQGRAELGPRALGNRSVIADPRRKAMWRSINAIKGREWWRPLAPSLLDFSKYLVDAEPHEFMIKAFTVREEFKEVIPAVCHVDDTTRPQVVRREVNPNWFELIKGFGEITGEAVLLNTSFNIAGEPMVETPQDALRSFSTSHLDAMWLQGWLIRKR